MWIPSSAYVYLNPAPPRSRRLRETAQPCAVDPQKLAPDLCVVFAQARRAASRADRGRAELGECAGQRERAAERVVLTRTK